MKEITRRLYTKPVMLGMSIFVGLVLLVGLFVTTKSTAASTFIPAGDDLFETTNNGETYHNFAASPLPAGFFNFDGAGTSHAFDDLVPLEGQPLTTGSDIDTIIHRNQDVNTPGTTTLTMTGLSLVSIKPITVTYSDRPAETWRVHVGLSAFKSSTGSMTIHSGGTFDSSLNVYPKFTFTRESDKAVKEFDTGAPTGPGLMASMTATHDGSDVEPGPQPEPTVAPAPCRAVIGDTEGHTISADGTASATSSSSCPPVTLTSSNSPWGICGGKICFPVPITEAELLARHFASPPGTKKQIRASTINTAQ